MKLLPAIAVLAAIVSAAPTVVAEERREGFDPRRAVIFEDPAPSPLRTAISPDGKLRVESECEKIRVYEVEENRLLQEFNIRCPTGSPYASYHMESPLFSADGATLFAAVSEGNLGIGSTLYSWNLETGERTRWGKCRGVVMDIATDAKAKRLAATTCYMTVRTIGLAADEDKWIGGEIVVFDTGKLDASVRIFCELPVIPHPKQFRSDLKKIKPQHAQGPYSEEFKNLMNNLCQQLADANSRYLPVRVGLTPDGDKVLGVTSTGVVRVFDAETGKPALVLSSQGRVSPGALSPPACP